MAIDTTGASYLHSFLETRRPESLCISMKNSPLGCFDENSTIKIQGSEIMSNPAIEIGRLKGTREIRVIVYAKEPSGVYTSVYDVSA
jgi:hypothetical protein